MGKTEEYKRRANATSVWMLTTAYKINGLVCEANDGKCSAIYFEGGPRWKK